MQQVNFNDYKFHPSSVKKLMTNGRKKGEEFGETAKSFLKDIYIQEVFGRKKDIQTKEMKKGTLCENEALELIEQVTKQKYFKNHKTLENEFLIGTPDVITPDMIIDIKNAWDIWTFGSVTQASVTADYYYQLLCYMQLTGLRKAQINYCLVDTPEELISGEMYKLSYQFPHLSQEELEERFLNWFVNSDIEPEKRLKVYEFEFCEEDWLKVEQKIIKGREYLEGITL